MVVYYRRNVSGRFDRDIYKSRLLGRHNKRKLRLRGRGKNIHQEVGRKTVRDVVWEFQVVMLDFSILGMGRNPPRQGIDEYIGRSRKGGPVLDMVVRNETEHAMLREYCSLVVD